MNDPLTSLDYDKLMQYRLDILRKHNLGIKEIQETISKMDPYPGCKGIPGRAEKLSLR